MKNNLNLVENFYQNSLFTFDSYESFCRIDTIYESPKDVRNVIKIFSENNKPIKFAFEPKNGLVRISLKTGAVEESDILSSLLSINANKVEGYQKFFEKNGFFFPIFSDKVAEIEAEPLLAVISRMRATVELMSQISEIQRKNYEKILTVTLALLLSSKNSIAIGSNKYESCEHNTLYNELDTASQINDNESSLRMDNQYNFIITDSIFGEYKVSLDEYRSYKADYDVLNLFWRRVFHSYFHHQHANKNERLIIEVLFHSFKDIGRFEFVTFNSINFMEEPRWENYIDRFKKAVLDVARIVVAEEINSNITGVYPEYDSNIMEPRWRVESLMSALYFSIFYMKPNLELTRLCENPKCGRYFKVSRTSLKKKYCCTECANRANQNRYRARKKEVTI